MKQDPGPREQICLVRASNPEVHRRDVGSTRPQSFESVVLSSPLLRGRGMVHEHVYQPNAHYAIQHITKDHQDTA